jgi:hypothetical protein
MEKNFMSAILATRAGVVVAGTMLYASHTLQKKFPPKSDAPEFGSLVIKKLPNGTEKTYRVITATGHDKKVCQSIKEKLESKSMDQPLYHTRNLKVTQSHARNTGAVAYIGIDANFPYSEPRHSFQNHVPFESADQRYENSGFFPIDLDGLNDKAFLNSRIKVLPDFQVVHIENVSIENKVGFLASAKRAHMAWKAGEI